MTLQILCGRLKNIPDMVDASVGADFATINLITDVVFDFCHLDFDLDRRTKFEESVWDIVKQPLTDGVIDSVKTCQRA